MPPGMQRSVCPVRRERYALLKFVPGGFVRVKPVLQLRWLDPAFRTLTD